MQPEEIFSVFNHYSYLENLRHISLQVKVNYILHLRNKYENAILFSHKSSG